MSFDGARGRLAELGERQRRAQLKAARGLLLCDRDGGQEGVLRGRGVGGVALQQHFAAHSMQFRFECAIAQAVAPRQRFVEDGDGAIGIARPGFGLGQPDLQKPVEHQNVLFAQALRRGACPRVRRRARRCATPPNPAETRRTRPTSSARTPVRGGRVRMRSARRARGSPRINSNMAACILVTRACRHE